MFSTILFSWFTGQASHAASNLITGIKFSSDKQELIIYSRYKIKSVYTYELKKKNQYVIDVGKIKVSTKIKSDIPLSHSHFSRMLIEGKSRTTQIILVPRGNGKIKLTAQKSDNRIVVSWQVEEEESKNNFVKNITLVSSLSELLKIECQKTVSKIKLFYSSEPNRMIIDILDVVPGKQLKNYWPIQNDILESIQIRSQSRKTRVILNFSSASSASYKVYQKGSTISIIPKPGVVLVRTLNQMVENLRFKTDLTLKYSRDIEKNDNFESSRDIRLLYDGGIKYSWGLQNFIKAGFRYRYVEEYDPTLFTFSDIRFSETYINLVGSFMRLGLGYQTVRWGRTDEFSPIDVINPEDLTEMLINSRAERKMPVPLARLAWFSEWVNIEAVYVPWFNPSVVIYRDSDWAVLNHLPEQLASSSFWLRDFDDLKFVEKYPEDDIIENREGGIRLTKSFNNFDVGVTYYYGWDKTPLIESRSNTSDTLATFFLDPDQISSIISSLPWSFWFGLTPEDFTYDLTYHRFEMYGVDLEATFWNIGFRTEIAYFDNKCFQHLDDLSIIKKKMLHYVVGFDHFVWENFYVNFLFSHAEIFDYDRTLIGVEQTEMDLVGNVSWEILRDAYTLELSAGYDFQEESTFLNPVFKWHQSDNLEFEAGMLYILIDEEAPISILKNNENFYVKGRFHF